jgi:predicted kinase
MIILVSGLPGSGKSYFASRLASELDAVHLSSDSTRKQMEALGQYVFHDTLTVYEEMAKQAGALLRDGKVVVVDATFYRHEMRELFQTLAKLLHEKLVSIEIIASESLIKQRLSKPRPDSDADFSVYRLVKAQYEQPDDDHLVLESASDNIADMLAKGKEYLTAR